MLAAGRSCAGPANPAINERPAVGRLGVWMWEGWVQVCRWWGGARLICCERGGAGGRAPRGCAGRQLRRCGPRRTRCPPPTPARGPAAVPGAGVAPHSLVAPPLPHRPAPGPRSPGPRPRPRSPSCPSCPIPQPPPALKLRRCRPWPARRRPSHCAVGRKGDPPAHSRSFASAAAGTAGARRRHGAYTPNPGRRSSQRAFSITTKPPHPLALRPRVLVGRCLPLPTRAQHAHDPGGPPVPTSRPLQTL
jgi:hypothetical protein